MPFGTTTLEFDVGTPFGLQFAGFDQLPSTPTHARSIGAASGANTVSVNARVAVWPAASSCTVNGNVPLATGVPAIVPVAGSSDRFDGNWPDAIDQTPGVVDVSVCE